MPIRGAAPPRTLLLPITLTCTLAISVGGLLWPATTAAATDQAHQSRHKHKPVHKTSLHPSALTTVQDVRVYATPERTRLVLDLDRQVQAVERRSTRSREVLIALPNATLSTATKNRLRQGAVPAPLRLTQSSTRSVALALPAGSFAKYQHYSLTNPPRLVVDVVPATASFAAEHGNVTSSFDSLPQPTPPQSKAYTTIVIDPGHGGKDPGARGRRGTEEKDITLKVALQLRDLLSKHPGVRVLMTRERDVFVELKDRAKFANAGDADLFVSIHVNSHPSRSINGIEVYHFGEAKDQRALEVAARENGTPLNNTGVGWEYLVADLLTTKKVEESLELAWTTKQAMVAQMNGHYPVHDHGVKTAPFYVLRFTSMPSILAEIAYISNPDEETLLRKPAFVHDIAHSLFQGVKSYLAHSKSAAKQ